MRIRGTVFETDRNGKKLLGVCSGLANTTGVDATIIRIALVIATVMGGWPWTAIFYVAAAIAGAPRRNRDAAPYAGIGREEASERLRTLDLRMQAIETYTSSSESQLAREIEALR